MNKFYSALAVLAVLALGVRAETDYVALEVIRDIQQGADNANRIERLKVGTSADIDGTFNVDGAATFGSLEADSFLAAATGGDATTLTVTNGQIFVLSTASKINLSANGQASVTTTNTIAPAAAAYIGYEYTLVNVGTDTVSVADAAPVYSALTALGPNDTLVLRIVDTNRIVQIGGSNN